MANIQSPITIWQAMHRINNNEYLLPAFQREFVWEAEQIENLFDSLMRDYPIGIMLFWKVKSEDTKKKWKYYEFIQNYINGIPEKNDNKECSMIVNKDFYAVLDGQQRLTALRIGLFGTYSEHEKNKKWEYSSTNFPEKKLYLNISKQGNEKYENKYYFKFLKISLTNDEDFYYQNGEKWFKVSSIMDYYESQLECSDYFDEKLTQEEKICINQLKNTIYTKFLISYYEEESDDVNKVLDIFTRINSGGTPLLLPDIIFSYLVSNWTKIDARNERKELFKSIKEIGFEIETGYLVKAFLYLFNSDIKTKISYFNEDFCTLIENKWDGIKEAIGYTFKLLCSFGFTKQTLTSNNATLPILYYLYHKNIYSEIITKKSLENDRNSIKRWILDVIIRKTFGGHTDGVLQRARNYFTSDINSYYIDEKSTFDGKKINVFIKDVKIFDDERIEALLETQKDNAYAFAILALLYPNLDYKNNDFNKDHIHPLNAYDSLSSELKEKYKKKDYNSIVNLQMLDANENKSKRDKSLAEWVKYQCDKNGYDKLAFLNTHLIPNVSLELDDFDIFYRERKELLKKHLRELLIINDGNNDNL